MNTNDAQRTRRKPQLGDIQKTSSTVAKKNEPDPLDKREEVTLEQQAQLIRNSILVSNQKLRESYANKVFKYLVGYSVGAGVITILSGFKLFGFDLPDLVLTAIVGSTAAAAIGLVGFVVNGLFKSDGRNQH